MAKKDDVAEIRLSHKNLSKRGRHLFSLVDERGCCPIGVVALFQRSDGTEPFQFLLGCTFTRFGCREWPGMVWFGTILELWVNGLHVQERAQSTLEHCHTFLQHSFQKVLFFWC